MAPANAITNQGWPLRADERDHIGWAEYVDLWLTEQVPTNELKAPAECEQLNFSDAPFATGCLLEALNG
jgi:hypothetical protein